MLIPTWIPSPWNKERPVAAVDCENLQYVEKNRSYAAYCLGETEIWIFRPISCRSSASEVFSEWRKRIKVDETVAEYLYTYVATGSIGIIRKWLFEEDKESPEKMAALVARLANKGIEAFISQNAQ